MEAVWAEMKRVCSFWVLAQEKTEHGASTEDGMTGETVRQTVRRILKSFPEIFRIQWELSRGFSGRIQVGRQGTQITGRQ